MQRIEFDPAVEMPVMEHFYTIQGEGFHQGRAAYFVRLAGCDVGCTWCDVKESWEVSTDQLVTTDFLLDEIKNTPAEIVVITGGEPLVWDLSHFTKKLQAAGLRTHIETSGAYPLSGNWDWVCLSPKRFKAPLDEMLAKANELKVIVYHSNDLRWGERFTEKLSPECKMYLQPEWSKEKEMIPTIIEYIKAHPKWEISLQLHKYLDVP